MKYVLLIYVAGMALALTLRPAPAKKGSPCGPGVLCIRTQNETHAAVKVILQKYALDPR